MNRLRAVFSAMNLEISESEAKTLLEALDCYQKNWAFSFWDQASAESLSDRIIDTCKENGFDPEKDEEDDE